METPSVETQVANTDDGQTDDDASELAYFVTRRQGETVDAKRQAKELHISTAVLSDSSHGAFPSEKPFQRLAAQE